MLNSIQSPSRLYPSRDYKLVKREFLIFLFGMISFLKTWLKFCFVLEKYAILWPHPFYNSLVLLRFLVAFSTLVFFLYLNRSEITKMFTPSSSGDWKYTTLCTVIGGKVGGKLEEKMTVGRKRLCVFQIKALFRGTICDFIDVQYFKAVMFGSHSYCLGREVT